MRFMKIAMAICAVCVSMLAISGMRRQKMMMMDRGSKKMMMMNRGSKRRGMMGSRHR